MNDNTNFIEWDDAYLVNIPELDEAHMGIFKLVNSLHESHKSDHQDKKKTIRALHDFLEYTYSHFADEESFMIKLGYSGVEEHRDMHRGIRDQFEKHFKDFKEDALDMNMFLEFTKNWLQEHIITEDQKYVSK